MDKEEEQKGENQSEDSLKEGIDYTINKHGMLVFTAHYLQKRGYCCNNGCLHCPYDQ